MLLAAVARADNAPAPTTRSSVSLESNNAAGDYPDLLTYVGREADILEKVAKVRAEVRSEIDERKQGGANQAELEPLLAREKELALATADIRKVQGFQRDQQDLAALKVKIENERRDLAAREEALEKDRLEVAPAIAPDEKALAEESLRAISLGHEALKTRLGASSRLLEERRRARGKALAEWLAIDPDAPRMTAESTRRWRLGVELALLDRVIPFLRERNEVWQGRLALLGEERQYWNARLPFVASVLEGRHRQRIEKGEKLARIDAEIEAKRGALAAAEPDSPEAKKAQGLVDEFTRKRFIIDQELAILDREERLEAGRREREDLARALEEAQHDHHSTYDEIREDLARARNDLAERRTAVERHEAAMPRAKALLEEEVAAATRARDQAHREDERVSALDRRASALESALAKTVKLDEEVLALLRDEAGLAERIVAALEQNLIEQDAKRSLLIRDELHLNAAELRRAIDRARAQARALEDAVSRGEPLRGRPAWFAGCTVLVAGAALILFRMARRVLEAPARGGRAP